MNLLLLAVGLYLIANKGRTSSGLYFSQLPEIYRNQLQTIPDPELREKFSFLILTAIQFGYLPEILSLVRTHEEQEKLNEQFPDRSAPAGTSKHERGRAMDVRFYKGDQVLNTFAPLSDWLASGIPQAAEAIGLRWGGRFSSYDPNHFDG